jgi:hypothetical protein
MRKRLFPVSLLLGEDLRDHQVEILDGVDRAISSIDLVPGKSRRGRIGALCLRRVASPSQHAVDESAM